MYVSECFKSEGQVNLSRLSCTGCAGVRPEDVALINKINPVETPHTTPVVSCSVQIWRGDVELVVSGWLGVVDTGWLWRDETIMINLLHASSKARSRCSRPPHTFRPASRMSREDTLQDLQ